MTNSTSPREGGARRARATVLLFRVFSTALPLGLAVGGLCAWGGGAALKPAHVSGARPWLNTAASPSQRAAMLLATMSQDDKIQLVHGNGAQTYAGVVPGNTARGIPTLNLQDCPWGAAGTSGPATVFPQPITMASAWDPSLATQYGAAVGAEQFGSGANVDLGPTMNMDRVPLGGRESESYGEDPYLSGQIAAGAVTGTQSAYVIATIKHFIDNDQENNRMGVNVVIDDRTQHEIYMPPFKQAVQAGAGAVMCSFNMVNGTYACDNDAVLNGWLKKELGFQGWVMSDWGGNTGTTSCLHGMDMDTPGGDPTTSYFGTQLASAITSGKVPQSRLDDMVTRILTSMFAVGLFDHPTTGTQSSSVTSAAHFQLAQDVAAQGTVLLANRGILPLAGSTIKTVAVIGSSADNNAVYDGGGVNRPSPSNLITPLGGIQARARKAGITVTSSGDDLTQGPSAAKAADVAIVVVGTMSNETADRTDLTLAGGNSSASNQDQLVAAVAAAQPKTIVVVYSPAQVLMPWASQAAAVIWAGLGGEQEGNGLAGVLFGDVNPGGKLPFTIAASASDYPGQTPEEYPGANGQEYYREGPFIGYRHLDDHGIKPQFPFGHGLSYTTFGYANIGITPASLPQPGGMVTVTADITNSGGVAGSEVAQLYVGFPAEASEPPWQLKGFQKVTLMPGAKQGVTYDLDASSYWFWSAGLQQWVAYPGNYTVNIGSSETDTRLSAVFQVHGGPLDGTVYQAETGTLSGGATMASTQRHSTGAGYVALSGGTDTVMVDAPMAGTFSIVVRYSAADPKTAASLSVTANGGAPVSIACPWLANLDIWDFAAGMVPLNAGTNMLTVSAGAGSVNLDAITVAGVGMVAVPDAGVPPPAADAGSSGSSSSGGGSTSSAGGSSSSGGGATSSGGTSSGAGGSGSSGGTTSGGSSSSGGGLGDNGGGGGGCACSAGQPVSARPWLAGALVVVPLVWRRRARRLQRQGAIR